MNRSSGPKGRKPPGRDGAGKDRRPSGRGSGNFRTKSFARGNAPIGNQGPAARSEPGLIRLNKYIANAGICSRREADTYIAAGNVTVNGRSVTEMGYQVRPSDEVRFDGRLIKAEKKEYILLNKPKNFITTTKDEQGRRTVMELISSASRARLVPVGRLDRNTTGLLLFTNDGELAKKLTHPKHGVRKIYHVELNRVLKTADLQQIRDGVELEDGPIRADEVSYIDGATKREVGIEVHSGRNRIVRRIFEHLGYEVVKLDRVVFAGLTKKDLPRGHWRPLTKQEVINLSMIQ
ncbi:MAG TPA: pseudouridine synthase [Robiginitalea sp.]|nr:pseudouridine synthase [Robiginitalea sp.]